MEAAIRALWQLNPARIVVAVPAGSKETCDALRPLVDDVICGITPEPFHAVGLWYEDFSQTSDQEVRELLSRPTVSDAAEAPKHAEAGPDVVRNALHSLTGSAQDYDPLIERIGDAPLVLIGEASHGTHEFYRERAEITKRLIQEKNFRAILIEGDWPDAYRVNRYVHGVSEDIDAYEALLDFRRFPTWMWRNTDVTEFVEWLRSHNDAQPSATQKTGFYGLERFPF